MTELQLGLEREKFEANMIARDPSHLGAGRRPNTTGYFRRDVIGLYVYWTIRQHWRTWITCAESKQSEIDALQSRVDALEKANEQWVLDANKLRLGLRNCRALAMSRKTTVGWQDHISRFCEDAGVKGSLLRSDETEP